MDSRSPQLRNVQGVLILHRREDERLGRSLESLTASDDGPKLPGNDLAVHDRAKHRLGKAKTVIRVALGGVNGVGLRGENGADRGGGKAGGGSAVEVGSSQLSDLVADGDGVVVRVERGRLEDGASEERGSRGGDEQSLNELGSGALADERDARGVSSKRLDIGLDVVYGRGDECQLRRQR